MSTRQYSARHRNALPGNALMEYAVPMMLILVVAGVLATATGVTDIMAQYFMAASGHTAENLSDGTFTTRPMATNAVGSVGNGSNGFTAGFAAVEDGNGQPVASSGTASPQVYTYKRKGSRPAAPTSANETWY